jgi:hypothetical protein
MNSIDLTDPNVRARVEYLGGEAQRSIETQLVQKYPELLNVDGAADAQNRAAIYGVMNQNGWPLSFETLEAALGIAYQAGQITLPTYSNRELEAFDMRNPDTGKHVMTTARMREYLEKTRQEPPRPNMAEFLPTAGERTYTPQTAALDEEALAKLRENILRGTK